MILPDRLQQELEATRQALALARSKCEKLQEQYDTAASELLLLRDKVDSLAFHAAASPVSPLACPERTRRRSRVQELNSLLLAIRRINEHLLLAQSEEELYRVVCAAVCGLASVVGAWISLKMPDYTLKPIAWAGVNAQDLLGSEIRWDDSELGRGLLGSAARENRTMVADDVNVHPAVVPFRGFLRKIGARSYAAIPLVYEGKVTAVLTIFSRKRGYFGEETVRFLIDVAGDIGLGVKTMRLDRDLRSALMIMRKSRDGAVETIASMIEYRDPYTAGHERRVAELACAIGKELCLPDDQIEGLRVGGYIHDLGKIAVPAEILSKPTKLTEIEYQLVKQHAEAGYNILRNMEFPWPVSQMVLQHHERLDGSGYPNGLTGDAIILEARIVAVADVVEAMTSHRPYRPARGRAAAIREILGKRGTHFDRDVVDACVLVLK